MSIQRRNLIWIEPPLASGGMAEVWRVINRGAEGVQNISIVKRILLNYASNEEFKKMFIDEARITSQLHKPIQHPNIVQLQEFQQFEDEYLLFLEYINGPDVRKILTICSKRNIKFPISFSLYIVSEMLNGLYHAHNLSDAQGKKLNIIHRDISPQNILVSYAGDVKIIDWGIADAKLKSTETVVGVIKGKYGYMSPEQANGDKLDNKTDMYSAAIVLWEMLTGRRLFVHENDLKVLKKIQKAEIVNPRNHNPDIPKSLANVVLRALSRKKDKRYQDCADFAHTLNEERNKIDSGFNRIKLASFLQDLFKEDIAKDQEIIAKAEVQTPREIPPGTASYRKPPGTQSKRKVAKTPRRPRIMDAARAELERDEEDDNLSLEEKIDLAAIKESGLELDVDGDKHTNAYESFTPTPYDDSQKSSLIEDQKTRGYAISGMKLLPVLLIFLLFIMLTGVFILKNRKSGSGFSNITFKNLFSRKSLTGRTFVLDSPLTDIKITIAGLSYEKVSSEPLLIENLPQQASYLVEISKTGYETISDVITIQDNLRYEMKVPKMVLLGAMGNLLIKTVPRGAKLYIDGKRSAKVTPATVSLPLLKKVEIKLKRHGFKEDTLLVELQDEDKLLEKSVILTPEQDEALGEGKVPAILNIISKPNGVKVYINAKYACKTPCLYKKGAIDDVLKIDIQHKGYKKYYRAFPLREGTNYLDIELQPAKLNFGYVTIKSIPKGEIYIDNRSIGKRTPLLKHKLTVGRHKVKVIYKKNGERKSSTRIIHIRPGEHILKKLVLK